MASTVGATGDILHLEWFICARRVGSIALWAGVLVVFDNILGPQPLLCAVVYVRLSSALFIRPGHTPITLLKSTSLHLRNLRASSLDQQRLQHYMAGSTAPNPWPSPLAHGSRVRGVCLHSALTHPRALGTRRWWYGRCGLDKRRSNRGGGDMETTPTMRFMPSLFNSAVSPLCITCCVAH